jgi:hypothetical protein
MFMHSSRKRVRLTSTAGRSPVAVATSWLILAALGWGAACTSESRGDNGEGGGTGGGGIAGTGGQKGLGGFIVGEGAGGAGGESTRPGLGGTAGCREDVNPDSGAGGSTSGGPLPGGDAGDAGVLGCPGINDPLWPNPNPSPNTWVGVRPVYTGAIPLTIATDATVTWTAVDGPCETGAGTFADPTATATMFTCTRAGDVHVVVHVGLPGTSCDDSMTFLVQCQL